MRSEEILSNYHTYKKKKKKKTTTTKGNKKNKEAKPMKKKNACSLPSARDRSNIILGVPRSNHKEQDRFKDNIIKQ